MNKILRLSCVCITLLVFGACTPLFSQCVKTCKQNLCLLTYSVNFAKKCHVYTNIKDQTGDFLISRTCIAPYNYSVTPVDGGFCQITVPAIILYKYQGGDCTPACALTQTASHYEASGCIMGTFTVEVTKYGCFAKDG